MTFGSGNTQDCIFKAATQVKAWITVWRAASFLRMINTSTLTICAEIMVLFWND